MLILAEPPRTSYLCHPRNPTLPNGIYQRLLIICIKYNKFKISSNQYQSKSSKSPILVAKLQTCRRKTCKLSLAHIADPAKWQVFFPPLFFWVQQIIQNSMGVTFDIQTSSGYFTHGHPGWNDENPHQPSGPLACIMIVEIRMSRLGNQNRPLPHPQASGGPRLRPMRVSGSSAAITLTKKWNKLVIFSNKDVFLVYGIPVDCLLLIDNHSLLEANGVRPKNKLRSKQLRCTYFWPPEQRHGEINSPAYQWISQ